MAIPSVYADACLKELKEQIPQADIIGFVTEQLDAAIYLK